MSWFQSLFEMDTVFIFENNNEWIPASDTKDNLKSENDGYTGFT